MVGQKSKSVDLGDGVSRAYSSDASDVKGVMDEKNVPNSTIDIEVGTVEVVAACDNAGYHRSLKRRQVMMMTFGAGIGTGLWVGTGQALAYAGPAGIAIAYSITA